MCRISAHSCSSYTSLAFALFILLFPSQSTTKLPLKYGPNTTYFLALVKPNRAETCLRQGNSSGALRGRLRRVPFTSRGGGRGRGEAATGLGFAETTSALVGSSDWQMTLPVHAVLARANRAQTYYFPEMIRLELGKHASLTKSTRYLVCTIRR